MAEMPRCRDQHDQMFIELAHIGKADILITGDADLVVMAEASTFTVETPADFYRRMQRGGA